MADVKWIKITTDIFNNRKIRVIETMPEGYAIIVVWVKLLCLAGTTNDGGQIYLTKNIPYTEQTLSAQFNMPLATIQLALATFEKFEMIERVDNFLQITNWEKYQSVDRLSEIREYNRLAKQKSRAKQKLLTDSNNVNDKSMTSQRCQDTEEEREEEKDKEKESHSFILCSEEQKKRMQLERMGGSLGKGVVMLSEDQMDDLLDRLSLEEFNKYVEIVADCELRGKSFKRKTHYQAILDMVAKDRKTMKGS